MRIKNTGTFRVIGHPKNKIRDSLNELNWIKDANSNLDINHEEKVILFY